MIIAVLMMAGVIGMQPNLCAKADKINVGNGNYIRGNKHWVKEEPKDKPLNLELIPLGETKFKICEIALIAIKLENTALSDQKVDYKHIHVEVYDKDFKNIIASTSGNLSGSFNLKKGDYEIKKYPLEMIKNIKQPGEYIIWAYYSLPDDKGINSNDLKIRIEP